jgi:hypothetical protein
VILETLAFQREAMKKIQVSTGPELAMELSEQNTRQLVIRHHLKKCRLGSAMLVDDNWLATWTILLHLDLSLPAACN